MGSRRFNMTINDLPDVIPIFPLEGALLLPGGELPLNIFEPRHIQMVQDSISRSRMLGIVQPKEKSCVCSLNEKCCTYDIGCMGKITSFSETPDKRFLITLTGICRFKIIEELSVTTPYRQIKADWKDYHSSDLAPCSCCIKALRPQLINILHPYLKSNHLMMDWDKINDISDDRLLTCLSMICPFSVAEKQALLQAKDEKERCEMMITMIDFVLKNAQEYQKH